MKRNFSANIFLATIVCILISSCSKNDPFTISETFHISYKGAEMPAYVHGNSENKTFLLVLHGAGSFGLAFRDGIFTRDLEKDYVVIYFDQRGQSMSEGNYQQEDDVISLMAEDVAILTKVIKKRYGDDISLFILGHSLGGMISATSLIKHDQNQYSGWINIDGLMDTPSVKEERKKLITNICESQIQQKTKLEEEWTQLNEALDDTDDYDEILSLASSTIKLLERDEVVNKPKSNSKIFQAVVANNPINWLVANFFNQPAQSAIANNLSLLDSISQIAIPTIWIYGRYDVSVPPATGQKAFNLLNSEDREFYLFDRSIHHPHDSEPERFSELLVNFLEKYR